MKPVNGGKEALGQQLPCRLSAVLIVTISSLCVWGESPKVAWNGQVACPVDPRHVHQLIEKLGDLSFEVREQASSKLAQIGPDVLPAVLEGTESADLEVVYRCWGLIDLWASQGDVSALLTQLRNRCPSTRAGAAESLAKLEPRPLSAVPGLLDATDDPIDFVRVSAREALKKIQETRGLRIEFQETGERLEVGGQTVLRVDITNCGKESVGNIRLCAKVPAHYDVTTAQGVNRPLKHETLPGRIVSEPFDLEPNTSMRCEFVTRVLTAGEARFKIELTATGLPHPLIEEKANTIFAPTPKTEPTNP